MENPKFDLNVSKLPFVSVIIPHYNDLKNLDICLELLTSQSMYSGLFEIVVVDNNSPCDYQDIVKIVKERAKLVVEYNQGAGPARNHGVSVAEGSIYAFIDSDCRPKNNWIQNGVNALASYDFVGGCVSIKPQDPQNPTPSEAFEMIFEFDFERFITKYKFTGSGNMFVSKEVFSRVGHFKAEVSEDVEWSHRALNAGYSLGYAASAEVEHPARQNFQQLKTKWRRHTVEGYKLHLHQGKRNYTWLFRSFAVLISPLFHLKKILSSDKIPLRSKVPAALILIRLRFYRFAMHYAVVIK